MLFGHYLTSFIIYIYHHWFEHRFRFGVNHQPSTNIIFSVLIQVSVAAGCDTYYSYFAFVVGVIGALVYMFYSFMMYVCMIDDPADTFAGKTCINY